MSKLAQAIEQKLGAARVHMATVTDGEVRDDRDLVTEVLAAHDDVVTAREMSARMSDSIYKRGIEALIREADEEVTSCLCRLVGGDGA